MAKQDLETALDTLKFLHPDGRVFELCIISPSANISNLCEGKPFGKKRIVAGWFNNPQKAANLAVQIEAEGIYTTLNPCTDGLLARANQRLKANVDRTADNHIERIKNILIDLDPIRPSGISSTDPEHEAALEMAQIIKADLIKEGWTEPLVGDSGNGGHLTFPVDLPNNQESVALVKAVLEALAWRYRDELKRCSLEIDQMVFNPARLTKLYGTMTRKGENTEDRPHRQAKIISLPETRQAVPLDLLKRMATTDPSQGQTRTKNTEAGAGRLDVEAYLTRYGREVSQVKPHGGATLYCLAECIFDPSHTDNEAAIGQAADGTLFFQCFHKSCKGRTWTEARAKISGRDKLSEFFIGGGHTKNCAQDKPNKQTTGKEPIQQETLLTIAAAAELFHAPDDESFARISVNDHLETWAIKGSGFKKWLRHGFYKLQGKAPQAEIFSSTIKLLEAKALFEGPLRPVWVRVAEHDGAIYLDLGNDSWEAVKVTTTGWEVVADPPVCFRRPRGMLPLPYPVKGSNISEFRPFVNVASDEDFLLVIIFLLNAMRSCGPYPIPVFNGGHGSAKSTTARCIRSLVDPNISPLRSPPREERDLMISATNSWMLAFDNLSGIPPWLSDAYCRLSTGGGISNRQLYTDGDEHIMDAMRPVILNGIDSLTERPDLADRALIFNLKMIPKEARRPEKKFFAEFEKARPRILGALLDAASMGLRNQHRVRLAALPRMADFAIWGVACEPALPWPPGSFMAAYTGNREEAVEISLEADVVAVAVRAHMADREEWSGTPSELYKALKTHVADDTQKTKEWPKAAHVLTSRLKRAATFLRAVGLKIDFGKSGDRKTTITRKSKGNSVQSVQSDQPEEYQGFSPDASRNGSVQPGASSVQEDNGGEKMDAPSEGLDASQKKASTGKDDNQAGLDAMDASDASLHTLNEEAIQEFDL